MAMVRVWVLAAARPDAAARLAAILATAPRGSVGIQVRDKALDGGPLLALARDVLAVARPAGAPVSVNERLDVACAAGAGGVHLPERGMAIADARAAAELLAGGRTLAIGASRHSAEGALAAAREGAALVQLGPIWNVPGKGAPLGPQVLRVRTELPAGVQLVAVGGIDSPERATAAAAAGADAVAVIRAAWTTDDPAAAIAALVAAVDAGRAHAPAG